MKVLIYNYQLSINFTDLEVQKQSDSNYNISGQLISIQGIPLSNDNFYLDFVIDYFRIDSLNININTATPKYLNAG